MTTEERLERWACLIYESMSAPSRTFHRIQHVFDISKDCNEAQTLATLFHDTMYYNIDGGLSAPQNEVLKGIARVEPLESVVILRKLTRESDNIIAMVMSILGFYPSQRISPFKGLNEFLSEDLAVCCLEEELNLPELARIAAKIEATTPFRE